MPAIQQLLSEGININITLLFAIERYEEVALAYLAGLESLARDRASRCNRIASVASFFVSRIDVMVDKQLEWRNCQQRKTPEEHSGSSGWKARPPLPMPSLLTSSLRKFLPAAAFQALAKKGARVQRMLWASTGTKNPKYSDTLYIDTLIGPETINTMPAASLEAYRDHGKPALRIEDGPG